MNTVLPSRVRFLLPSGGRTARQHSGAHPSYPCPRPGAVGRRIWLSPPAAGQESRDSFSDALTDGRGQRKENLAAFALLGIDKHKGVSFGRPSRPSERRNIHFLRRLRIFRRSRSCGHSRICPARRQALSQNPCALIIGHVIGQIVRFCILSSCPPVLVRDSDGQARKYHKTHLPPKVEARAGIALPVTAPDKPHAFRRSARSRSIRLSGSSAASSFGGSGITSLHRADTLRPSAAAQLWHCPK